MTGRFDLYSARINRGLSQRDAAEQCGVPLTTFQNLEAGRGAQPRNAKKVADFFGVKATDLIPPRERAA